MRTLALVAATHLASGCRDARTGAVEGGAACGVAIERGPFVEPFDARYLGVVDGDSVAVDQGDALISFVPSSRVVDPLPGTKSATELLDGRDGALLLLDLVRDGPLSEGGAVEPIALAESCASPPRSRATSSRGSSTTPSTPAATPLASAA